MKKAFLITSMLVILLLCSISVLAFESSMTNTYLVADTNGYTFESVITPTVTAECMPIIAMYDSNDLMCGLMYGETISLTSGKPVVKTFTVTPDSVPSSIKLMLWKADGSFAPLCGFEQVSTSLYSEKYGMIVEAASGTGVEMYTVGASGTAKYDFADKFILSYGSNVVSDSKAAYTYLNTLRLKSYKRYADNYEDGDKNNYYWSVNYDWILSFSNNERYSSPTPSDVAFMLHDDYRYEYDDFMKNYASRMVRILVSGDKIGSMAFANDSLFDKLNKGKPYAEAFYTAATKQFNDSLNINENTKLLYIPAKSGADESQFKTLNISGLKNGNLYHLHDFTTQSGEQIILITYMLTETEVALYNRDPVKNIEIALNGDGTSTIKGLTNSRFSFSLSTDNNDTDATKAANDAIKYVKDGLQGALVGADEGYAITKNYIKIKFKSQIDAASEQINILQNLDTKLNLDPGYYNELINKIEKAIGLSASGFLQKYFLGN